MQSLDAYYDALQRYGGLDVTHETALRTAMYNVLNDAGREVGWTLVPEQRLPDGKRPDGTFRDGFNLARGYWEAKDTKDDLETEIKKKVALGYPLVNTLFEDTRRAVLYQGRDNRTVYDLTNKNELQELLRQFVNYAAPDIEDFYRAVDEFATRLPELAAGLMQRIETERDGNRAFQTAFAQFHDLCRTALNPNIGADTIEEMLVQHLLTERLFRTIFENPDFTRRNIIAHEIENVIDALTSRAFNRAEFLRSLDRFYVAIETKGRNITDWNEKQGFLNRVYERFFQGFSVRQADTHGIVYTPQEIVAFMCASVEHILQTEFQSSLSNPGVMILDPCVGTGNFLVHLIRHQIARRDLRAKFQNDLFANEIMLLPYYIASLNIEHEYYAQTGEYHAFEGLCFADTLALAKGSQITMFEEANAARTEREQDAPITVIIGNPPYNVGQQNENDNNKNRHYDIVESRIRETYARASKATNKNALSDAYIKFFRWATDRLGERDGVVAFVSNNGFVNGVAFDGMRKHLADEFTTIYHLDTKGNARTSGERRRAEGGNVFNDQIRTGIGITLLVRRRISAAETPATAPASARILYYAVADYTKAQAKLAELTTLGSVEGVTWQELTPDNRQSWFTEGLQTDFDTFLPFGTQDGKASKSEAKVIFKIYGRGAETSRDSIVYDFNYAILIPRVQQFIEDYNAEIDRWNRAGRPKDIDNFVSYHKVKWSSRLKECFARSQRITFDNPSVRNALYRPFCRQFLYFDAVLTHRQGRFPVIFPTPESETENVVIVVGGYSRKDFSVLAANCISDLNFYGDPAQCFPFYVYDRNEDGSTNRRENITDWSLQQFRDAHGPDVTKWDIFHYVYALLHDPAYRERYAENLKRDLPRVAPVPSAAEGSFFRYARIGAELCRLHRDYEAAPEYRLQWIENRDAPESYRVERMRLSKDRTQIVVNEALTLAGIPEACFDYRLGNRSALEWVLDQYQITTDKRSGIVSDPNRPDEPQYIVRLVGKVITVSLETVRLVASLREPGDG